MKIYRFNESNNGYLFDEDTKSLANEIRKQTMILEMIISGFGKGSLDDINIDELIEKIKELKIRLDAKNYNL